MTPQIYQDFFPQDVKQVFFWISCSYLLIGGVAAWPPGPPPASIKGAPTLGLPHPWPPAPFTSLQLTCKLAFLPLIPARGVIGQTYIQVTQKGHAGSKFEFCH